jgi:hypothetical protein
MTRRQVSLPATQWSPCESANYRLALSKTVTTDHGSTVVGCAALRAGANGIGGLEALTPCLQIAFSTCLVSADLGVWASGSVRE